MTYDDRLELAKVDVIMKKLESLKSTHEPDEVIEQMICYEWSGMIDTEARLNEYLCGHKQNELSEDLPDIKT